MKGRQREWGDEVVWASPAQEVWEPGNCAGLQLLAEPL